MSAEPLLRLRRLSKIFAEVPVVDRVDLAVSPGEIVMIIGPSGAGKSTLLRCVNRIETPSEGEILIAGSNWRANCATAGWSPTGQQRPRQSAGASAWSSSVSTCFRI